MNKANSQLWAKSALLPQGWADGVLIRIDQSGTITEVQPDCSRKNASEIIEGVMVPGMTNLHSHAHQRAMAGLAEQAGLAADGDADSFWSWRKVMYHYLERIEPDDLNAISTMLYVEMLKSGYTGVGEFQYLHHDKDGHPYSERAEMTLQCWQAAQTAGVAFTALPVLYCHGGFGGQPPDSGQARFINSVDGFAKIYASLLLNLAGDPNATVGIAPHSLRAVTADDLASVQESCEQPCAIHIHVAEQVREVEDSLAFSGQRPVEWLLDNVNVDDRWCLIHATHMTQQETRELAAAGAVVGLCPTTEANLGDGLFNAREYFSSGGHWGIGSDSHISISPVEELRWLEYGQRLKARQRNVLASPGAPHTGASLYNQALSGGARATGRNTGQIRSGARADLVVVDDRHPRLFGRQQNELLDSWIFSGNENPVLDVYVGGIRQIENGRHVHEDSISRRFKSTLKQLAG